MSNSGSCRASLGSRHPVARDLLLGVDAHVQADRQEAGLAAQRQRAPDRVHAPTRRLQVLATRDRVALEAQERRLGLGDGGQLGLDRPGGPRAPQPEQPVEPLPVGPHLGLCERHVHARLAIEDGPVLQLQVVDGARVVLPLREQGGGGGQLPDEAQARHQLPARLQRHVAPP